MAGKRLCFALLTLVMSSASILAGEGYVTTTFGPGGEHPDAVKFDQGVLTFDLSALPKGAQPVRAVLRGPANRPDYRASIVIVPQGLKDAKPLELLPPAYRSFDALAAVKAWLAAPASNQGLEVRQSARLNFSAATLEIGYVGPLEKPLPVVTNLKAEHRNGQTFITWTEVEDVIGKDGPTQAEFQQALRDARAKRTLTYRLYRGDTPVSLGNIGQAQLLRELPEAVGIWDRDNISPGSKPPAGGAEPMLRVRIADGAEPLPRATGLAVITVPQAPAAPSKRYYAVTVAVNGKEALAELKNGQNLVGPVEETPSSFPNFVCQRSIKHKVATEPLVDQYFAWLDMPYVSQPRLVEMYQPRWPQAATGPDNRLPLYLNLGTYGTPSRTHSDISFFGCRQFVPGAITFGLAEQIDLFWAGESEVLGSLRSYEQGTVHNFGWRVVLGAAGWAMHRPDFRIDPERVYIWGNNAGWALRNGDIFAAAMSEAHLNLRTSREAPKHAWRWGATPQTSKNWLGMNHWDYLDMAKWVRENPGVEMPFWAVAPAYGQFPSHTLGDFGFRPWQEVLSACQETKRAFTASWLTNGQGETQGVIGDVLPRIRLHQSLPAFTNCSLDARIYCDDPKGTYPYARMDKDFEAHTDKFGGINLHQRWEPEGIVDEGGKWSITLWLSGGDSKGRYACPADECTTDLTPRRCQNFKPKPNEKFTWTVNSADGKGLQNGTLEPDKNGLVTVPGIKLTKNKARVEIRKQ